MYRVQGVDFECLDHPQRQAVAHRFEQALRQLDESFRVYQYVIKRPAPVVTAAPHPHPVVHEALTRRTAHFAAKREALFELELYLVVLYEGAVDRPHGRIDSAPSSRRPSPIRERLSVRTVTTVLADQLRRAIAHLHQKAEAFAIQLADTVRPPSSAGRGVSRAAAPRELHAPQGRRGRPEVRHAS